MARWWWRPRRVDLLILLATVLVGALLGVAAYAVSQVAEARSDAMAQLGAQQQSSTAEQTLAARRLDAMAEQNAAMAEELRAALTEQSRLAAQVDALTEQVRQLGAQPVATPRPARQPNRSTAPPAPRPGTAPLPPASTKSPPASTDPPPPTGTQSPPPDSGGTCLPILPICP